MMLVYENYGEMVRNERKELELIKDQIYHDAFNHYITDPGFYENRSFDLVIKGIEKFVEDYDLHKYYDKKSKRFEGSDCIIDFVEIAIWAKEKAHMEFCKKQCRML